MGLSTHYEANLVALIKQLRVQFGSPKVRRFLPCVCLLLPLPPLVCVSPAQH